MDDEQYLVYLVLDFWCKRHVSLNIPEFLSPVWPLPEYDPEA
jgi:hypothetical protein